MRAAGFVVFALLCATPLARADATLPITAKKSGKGTFCEFSVYNVENNQPIAGIRYKVVLPDGKVRRGRVPASGIVHYDIARAGDCTISLHLPRDMYVVGDPP